MAMIEELDKSGNWLFRWRSFLPLILYVLAALVVVFNLDTHIDQSDQKWMIICLLISLYGLFIRAIAIGFTPRGTSGRNTKEGQVAEVLNTKGIYSVCRHPLYYGNFFMWMGLIIYVGNWWFTAICILLFWLYYERIMFAEEHFLRKKFAQIYLNWAEKTPAFNPRWRKWKKAEVPFSIKNVMKREYNGFFAVFLSFALINFLRNFVHYDFTDLWRNLDTFWLYGLIVSFIIFIVLRTLKKNTKVLDVKGREYTTD